MKFRSFEELARYVGAIPADKARIECPQGQGCPAMVCPGLRECQLRHEWTGIRADRVWEGLLQFGVGPNRVRRGGGLSSREVNDRAGVLLEKVLGGRF